ncbi:hypothetical protein ACFLZO_00835, partial [Patescibacteria group bacterium]
VRDSFRGSNMFLVPFAIFFVLGAFLSVSAYRDKKSRTRMYLLLTGLSAVGIFVSMILHNVIYGLSIVLFGDGFWDRIGMGDEPVFFFLAILVFPLAFIIGVGGSTIGLLRRK